MITSTLTIFAPEPTWVETVLWIHAGSGLIALAAGIIPMISKKGGTAHNISGLVYFYCMMSVVVTAMPLAYVKANFFLASIAIFSFYMCFTGYRFTKLKPGSSPNLLDKIISGFTLITAVGMLTVGGIAIFNGVQFTGIVLAVFGIICLLMSISDFKRYFSKDEPGKMDWFFSHLGRMIGSYIATLTAFAAQNSPIQPGIINWLGPTVIGTIVIVLMSRHFKKKFNL